MKILLVGGTWTAKDSETNHKPRQSSIVAKMSDIIDSLNTEDNPIECVTLNGGKFSELELCLKYAKNPDITIWMPNVPDNDLPKLRDIKTVIPHTILITSKRNDNDKYSFGEIVRRALKLKSNLLIEFKRNTENEHFHMSIIDPLGNEWYSGMDIEEMTKTLIERATFLQSITRQGTNRNDGMFFDTKNNRKDDTETFISIVQKCGKVFNEYTPSADNTTRLLGNCSIANQTRCSKGFPTMRNDNTIFVSERNVDKKTLTVENLVPVKFVNDKIFYKGEKKPSVDTPIQVRLYELLPNINYMIHSHCYIKNAPFTQNCIPCGGLDEIKEIMNIIDRSVYGRDTMFFRINLKGHGSLVMAYSIGLLENIESEYYPREFPEKQY